MTFRVATKLSDSAGWERSVIMADMKTIRSADQR